MSATVHDLRKRRDRVEPPIVAGRPPPHDLDAEAAVIVACLARTKFDTAGIIDRVSSVLGDFGPEAFYNQLSARLWTAIAEVHASGAGVDATTVASRMRDAGTWNETLERHVAELTTNRPALVERLVIDHARIVVRKARLRRVISSLQEWTARGYGDVPDEAEFMRELAASVGDAARETGAIADVESSGEVEPALAAELEERRLAHLHGNHAGFPTGIPTLDALTGGLFPRQVHFLSAKRKGRKSTVATWIATSVAESTERVMVGQQIQSQRRGVVIFPLEMTKLEVQLVASCQRGGVDSNAFKRGTATAEDFANRERGASTFVHLPLVFDDRPGLSVTTLRERVREARGKLARGLPGRRRRLSNGTMEELPAMAPAPLRLVIIDTIQLLAKRTPHRSSELQAVTDDAGAAVRALSLEPEFARVSWLVISHENAEGRLRDSTALENHLTQWIKLDVSENSTPGSDRNELVAKFTVHLDREGEEGGVASAWLNRRTGAFS